MSKENEKVVKEVATDTSYITENPPIGYPEVVEEVKEKVINQIVVKMKLLNAQLTKKGKVGITGLLFDNEAPDSGFVGVQSYLPDKENHRTPVVQSYLEADDNILTLLNGTVMQEILALVSGKDNFIKVHKIFTPSEKATYEAMISSL